MNWIYNHHLKVLPPYTVRQEKQDVYPIMLFFCLLKKSYVSAQMVVHYCMNLQRGMERNITIINVEYE